MKRRTMFTLLLPAWGVVLLYWMIYINTYAATAESIHEGAARWPANSKLIRHPENPTLVMFLHPQCFCSRASLWELEELLARHPGQLSAVLVMVSDAAHEFEWRETTLQKQAAGIRDVTIVQDSGSLEASRFLAGTSGETYLYSPTGVLLFQGGITAARGHMGDAAGQEAIHQHLERRQDVTIPGPVSRCGVFGCRLTPRVESIP